MKKLFLLLILGLETGFAANTSTKFLSNATVRIDSKAFVEEKKRSLIGAVLDEQDRRVMERSSPRTIDRIDRSEPLTMNDVIKLSQAGVSDDTIIKYMKESQSSYTLSQAQIRRLQDGGVSERVIQYMIASER